MSRTLNRLSQLEVGNAGVGMHADGGGLYVQVTKTGSGRLNKSWLYRYTVAGRPRVRDVLRHEARESFQCEACCAVASNHGNLRVSIHR